MKILVILLFFILGLLVLSQSFSIIINIKEIRVERWKVRYKIHIDILLFKIIRIYTKKIKKKDINKIIDNIFNGNKRLRVNKDWVEIKNFELELDYGLKEIFINIYLFSFINALIPISFNMIKVSNKRKYNIKTNFNNNTFKIKVCGRIEILVSKIFIDLIRDKFKIKVEN